MSHDDFDFEAAPGLPAPLPAGENLLWQGAPDWKSLAVHAYHVRKVAIYFAALVLWRVAVGIGNGHTVSAIAISSAFLILLGGIAVGVLTSLAYFNARSTVYSITTRRVLLRHGVAVPLTMNVPFAVIESAGFNSFADGSGDIYLSVTRQQRVGYMISWPHVRPGKIARPCPSLRSLADGAAAAKLLGAALAAELGGNAAKVNGNEPAPPEFAPHTAAA